MPELEKRWWNDTGSGTALILAILAATVSFAVVLMSVLGAFAVHTRVAVAADAAALAAADTASGRIPGDPCARAQAAASLHGAELTRCESTREATLVIVSADFGWMNLRASARAGLPR